MLIRQAASGGSHLFLLLLLLLLLLIHCTYATSKPTRRAQATSQQQVIAQDLALASSSSDATSGNKWTQTVGDQPTSFFRDNSLADSFDQQATFDQYISYAMRALHLVAGYDNDLHRYDSEQDLIDSIKLNLTERRSDTQLGSRFRHPALEASELRLLGKQGELFQEASARQQLKCGRHLGALLAEARELYASPQSFSSSRQLKLIEFFDSYGAPEAQLMKGNTMWLGSHEQCSGARLKLSSGAITIASGRYCVANFRSPGWPQENDSGNVAPGALKSSGQSIKLGVCLPEACNTISYLRHANLIESLAKQVRLNQVPYSNYKLSHLYCLPDESSPLRQFSWSARIFIVSLSAWLTIIAYYTIKYELLRLNCLRRGEPETTNLLSKPMQILAFRLSWNKLFGESGVLIEADTFKTEPTVPKKHHDPVDGADSDQESGIDGSDSETSTSGMKSQKQLNMIDNFSNNHHQQVLESAVVIVSRNVPSVEVKKPAKVDLSSIDGIKVLSMIWLISGHTLLFFIRTIANGRDFWSLLRDARFMTIMAGIFPVDTFFTITGILTAYLKFNKNNGSDLKSARYWLEAFVHRYLRFMPMYLFVFWYTRDVSEYIGFGPLWDYATASTSLRSMCKQESALVPILFQANFKAIDQHCVKPAWYLANDYQFLLVTPLFMGLIMKSTMLGYSVIGLSVALSLALQFITVFYSTDMEDFEALINFKPMFGTYVLRNLWKLYVLPYNRVPPYLMGIVTGHLMYLRQTNAEQSESPSSIPLKMAPILHPRLTHNHNEFTIRNRENVSSGLTSNWRALREYVCINIWTPLIFLISIIYLPLVTKISTQEGIPAKVGTSLIMALMRFVWSLSIARLIYICATRLLDRGRASNGNNKPEGSDNSFVIRFLSSHKWKPWSKIGLSALLIQWEIISYLAQTQTSAPNITITFLLAVILICIVATYFLALLIYLTIEYPLSQIEQLYIRPAIFGQQQCSGSSNINNNNNTNNNSIKTT